MVSFPWKQNMSEGLEKSWHARVTHCDSDSSVTDCDRLWQTVTVVTGTERQVTQVRLRRVLSLTACDPSGSSLGRCRCEISVCDTAAILTYGNGETRQERIWLCTAITQTHRHGWSRSERWVYICLCCCGDRAFNPRCTCFTWHVRVDQTSTCFQWHNKSNGACLRNWLLLETSQRWIFRQRLPFYRNCKNQLLQ